MKTKSVSYIGPIRPAKRTYQAPKIQTLGSVRKLTLKLGSNVDGMGGFA